MSVPKFLNAHDSLKATERRTRAQVFGDDDDESVDEVGGGAEALAHVRREKLRLHHQDKEEGEGEGPGDAVRWLEAYLRASLVYSPPSIEEEEVARPLGRRRRRKSRSDDEEKREGTGPSTSVFEFRLLSGRKPPREINVLPKPSQIQSIEREYEDTPSRASLRTKQALEVAVDFDWVLRQSSIPTSPVSNQAGRGVNGKDKRKELVVTPNSNGTIASTPTPVPSDTSNLFIIELPKSHIEQPARAGTRIRRRASWEPSPHELKKKSRLCCPLIAFSSPALPVRTNSDAEGENILGIGRRRRRRARRSGSGKGREKYRSRSTAS